MARTGLQRLFIAHHRLAGVGVVGSGETLSLGLLPLKNWQREVIGHDVAIDLEHTQSLLDGLIFARVGSMPLLPEELRSTEEEARALFPAHDVAPLIYQDRQIAPRLNPFAVHIADDGLRGGAHDKRLLELLAARVGNDGALGGKTFDMLRLFGEERLRDQQREGGVDMSGLFEGVVKMFLHKFPYGVTRRPHDHTASYRRVVSHFRDTDNVKIPL